MLNDSRWLLRGSTVKTFKLLLIKNDWAVLFSILSYLTYYKPKTCLLYPHKCLFKHVSTQLVPIYHKLYVYLQFSTTDRNWHLNIWRVFELFVTVCHVEWHQNSAQSSHSDLELRYRMLSSPSTLPQSIHAAIRVVVVHLFALIATATSIWHRCCWALRSTKNRFTLWSNVPCAYLT